MDDNSVSWNNIRYRPVSIAQPIMEIPNNTEFTNVLNNGNQTSQQIPEGFLNFLSNSFKPNYDPNIASSLASTNALLGQVLNSFNSQQTTHNSPYYFSNPTITNPNPNGTNNGLSQSVPYDTDFIIEQASLGESSHNPKEVFLNKNEFSIGQLQQDVRSGGLDEMHNIVVRMGQQGNEFAPKFLATFGPIKQKYGSYKNAPPQEIKKALYKGVDEGWWTPLEKPVVMERYFHRALRHLTPEAKRLIDSNPYMQQFLFSRAVQMGPGDGTNGASGMINRAVTDSNGDLRYIITDAYDHKKAETRWKNFRNEYPDMFKNMLKRFTRDQNYYLKMLNLL